MRSVRRGARKGVNRKELEQIQVMESLYEPSFVHFKSGESL